MKKIEKLLLLTALLALLGMAVSKVHSFDLFWQLQSGRYMVETKSFIYQDIFSLAAEAPRYEHCWLHDLIFFAAYQLFGYAGISWLKGLLVAAVGAAAVLSAAVRGASLQAILALTLPAVLYTRGAWLERPQLWTFLFLIIFLLVLEQHRRRPGRIVWWLPLLLILWANLHAGSVLAFPLVFAYLAGEAAQRLFKRPELPKSGFFALLGVFCLLPFAALLTPYGMTTLQTLLYAPKLGEASGMITQIYNMDWGKTSFAAHPDYFYAMAGAGTLMLAGWRRFRLADLFLLAGLGYMGLQLERHTILFFLAAAVIMPAYLDAALAPLVSRLRGRLAPVLRGCSLVIAVGLIIFFARPVYHLNGFLQTGLRTWHYPVAAAEFVREQKLPVNLYNTYDWGGYLMWTLFPEYLVFWDGRSDSVEMFDFGLQIMRGEPQWQQLLDRFDVRTVVTKGCTVDTGQRYPVIDRLRKSPDWALVFADVSSMVFVRRDAVSADWLQQHELPGSRVDDTILSEAKLLVQHGSWRYRAFWEIARIQMERRQFREALEALGQYLARTPRPDPLAEQYYRFLHAKLQG